MQSVQVTKQGITNDKGYEKITGVAVIMEKPGNETNRRAQLTQ